MRIDPQPTVRSRQSRGVFVFLFAAILGGTTFPAGLWGASGSVTYSYDAAGRLLQTNYSGGTTTTYTLDAPGNRNTTAVVFNSSAPTVPTNVAGSAPLSTKVNLSWTASTDTHGTLAGYYVYRGGIQIGSSATASYVDTSTSGFTTYNYSIAAYDTAHPANVSAQSVPFTITTPDTIAPTVPTGLTKVSASSTQVVISWSASTDTGGSGLAGYRIYRGGTQIGTSGAATYTDTTVGGTTTYSYTVAAYDNAGNVSAKSSALMVTTPDTIPPSVPGFYFVTAVSTTEVNLSWSTSVDTGGSGLAGYKLYRNGALVTTQVGTTYSDSGLVAGTTYYYQVAAYDNAGNVSALSAAGYVTTPTGITDSPQLTVGVQGEGGISFEGFSLGAYGSITPGKTSTGFTYQAFADKYATSQPGYVSTIFSMSGFTSDPGQAWLTLAVAEGHAFSGNTASYFYSAGIASWTWTTGPAFTSGGTVPCTVVHQ